MVNAIEIEAKHKTEHALENIKENIPVHIINGKGHWSKEIGLEKTIDDNLKIRSPAEGSWSIKFEEGNDPNIHINIFH